MNTNYLVEKDGKIFKCGINFADSDTEILFFCPSEFDPEPQKSLKYIIFVTPFSKNIENDRTYYYKYKARFKDISFCEIDVNESFKVHASNKLGLNKKTPLKDIAFYFFEQQGYTVNV